MTGLGTLKAKDSLIMQQRTHRSLGLALEGSRELGGEPLRCAVGAR